MITRSIVAALAVAMFLLAADAHAQVPNIITYQGVFTDLSGTPIPDGDHIMTLNIYDASTGGTLLYTETQTVKFARGVFNVGIGSVVPMPSTLVFDRPYYLGIAIESNPEFSPRTQFTTGAYAMRARFADVAQSLSPNATGVISGINGMSGAVNIVGAGTTTVSQADGTITINGGGVANLNGATGSVNLVGAGGTTVTRVGNQVTIASNASSSGGVVKNIVPLDPSISVKDGGSPTVQIGVSELGITTQKIMDGAVTDAKLAGGISYSKIIGAPTSLPPSGPAGGDLSGTYPNPGIATSAVTTTKLADGSVATAKLADSSVTSAKIGTFGVRSGNIADGAVTTTKIADGGVSTLKLADGSVTTVKITDASITTAKLADASVTTSKLVDGSVTTPKLADGSVTTAKHADASVTTQKLADGSVTTPKIADGSVTTAKISDGSVNTAKLADASVTTPKVVDASITTPKVADAAITDAKVANGISYSKLSGAPTSLPPSGPAGGDLAANYPNPQIAIGAVGTNKLADGAVVAVKITDSTITGVKIVTSAIQTAHIANSAVTSAKIADGSIVDADVSPTAAVAYSKLALTNSIQNGDLTANSVTTSKVANGTVTTSKMADSAISGLKLLTFAVTNRHIADAAVSTQKIDPTGASVNDVLKYNGTAVVWGGATPTGAAGGDLTGTYPNPTVANNAITSAKILDGTIVDADVSPTAAVAYSKLALTNSIQNGDLTANSVTTSKVANGTVTTSKMADSAISGLKLLTFAVTNRHLADQAVTTSKIDPTGASTGDVLKYDGTNVVWGGASPAGAAGGDLTGTYPNPTVANNSITSAKILDGTIVDADVSPTAAIAYSKLALTNSIQNGDLTANSVTTSKVANGTVTTSKMADSAISGLKLLTFAVTTRHLADQSVTTSKINPTGASTGDVLKYDGTNVVWGGGGATGAAGGDLTGTYPNPTVANNSITSAKILDGTIVDADVSPTAAVAYSKLALTNSIQNGDITANAITTSKVANGTVTTSKMADSAISGLKLLTFAVTNRHLAANSVTPSKVDPTGASTGDVLKYDGTNVVWGGASPSGAAGGDLTGTYPNPTVANNSITSAKILDGTIVDADVSPTAAVAYSKLNLNNSIQNGDITVNAITTSKVANGTVTTSKMADSAISGLKLLTFAVTTRHLADQSVTLPKINPTGANTNDVLTYNGSSVVWASGGATGAAGGDLTGTYPNPTVANNSITSAKILDGTIVDADVSPTAAIAYSKLNLSNSIQNGDITANAITTAKVANGTVTTSKMADSAISGLKLLTFAVTTRHLADQSVTLPKINPTGANTNDVLSYNGSSVVWSAPATGATGAAGGSLAGTYPNPTIAASAVGSTEIADGSVQNQDVAANAITTSKVANGTVTTSKMADSAISGLKLLTFAVTNRHLAANSVTPSKIDPTGANTNDVLKYDGTNVVWGASTLTGAAGGSLAGTYPNPTIAPSAIGSTEIADGSVQNQDVAANAITTSKVANGTVTTSKMADSAISGLKLLTFAVTNRHLADQSVTTSKISPTGANTNDVLTYNGTTVVWSAPAGGGATGAAGGSLAGTYPNPTIAANAVGTAEIADGSITNADIIAGAGIPYSKLTLSNSIQNGDITANAITTSKVANGTVTTSKMADSAISGLKLLTFAVTNRHLATNAVTTDKISGAGAANGQVLMFNSGTNTVGWANPSVGFAFNRAAISNINSPYTVPAGVDIVGVDVTAGPVTVTLPPANSVPSGKILIVKNELGNAATNAITIQRNGTDLINAASTSVSITTGNAVNSFNFYSDGVSRWHQY